MADNMDISSVLDLMDVSSISMTNFSGFPRDTSSSSSSSADFSGFFRPDFHSTRNLESVLPVQTRSPLLLDLTFEDSTFIGYEDLSNSMDLSDMSDDAGDSIEDIQNAPILPEEVIQEEYRDLTPPFDVPEGIQGQRLMVIVKGTSKSNYAIVSEATGQVLVNNRFSDDKKRQTMRCKEYSKNKCTAQIVVTSISDIIRDRFGDDPDIEWFWLDPNDIVKAERHQHFESCPLMPGNIALLLMLRECRRQAMDPRNDGAHAMEILDASKALHCTPDTVTTWFPSDRNICQMINRVRQSTRARPPKKDKSDILVWTFMTNRLPEDVPADFYRGSTQSVYMRQTSRHFLFWSNFQMDVLRDSVVLIMDATFAVVRLPFFQLLTIHAQLKRTDEEGTVNMPVAYVLMMGKSQPAYEAVFEKIREIVPGMKVKEFIVDYERQVWNALRKVWPASSVRGCWFHYCQCIRRKVQNLKINKAVFEHGGANKMEKRLMTLPLVDKNNIPLLFLELKRHYQTQIARCPGVKALFDYMELMWISGRSSIGFTPEDYSCFEKIIRTTNIAEVWNGEIYTAGKRKKNDIYQLTKLLAKDAAHSEADLHQYAHKKYRKRAQVEKDKKIRKANLRYRQDGNLWLFLENLRMATKKMVRCNPGPVNENESAIAE